MTTVNSKFIVNELFHYPVKSFAGESISSASVLAAGFEFDRHWMLVDEEGQFLSQRKNPAMALLKAYIEEEQLILSIPGQSAIAINLLPDDNWRSVKVWNDQLKALNIDAAADKLVSQFMKKTCHLVVMSKQQQRTISDPAAQGIVSFADAFPYLLIGTKSLATLNNKLDKQVVIQNFRPNIVVSTSSAHEEDFWHEIMIGGVRFKNVKLCGRCILTTVDPETGLRSADQEPLKTLLSYRQATNSEVLFGCNLVAMNEGRIYQGDQLVVLSYKDQQRFN